MVDLPILVGWQLFGDSWLAEEVGIVLTAVLSLVLGVRWIAVGFGKASASPTRTPQPL
jgi:hypothetical protein